MNKKLCRQHQSRLVLLGANIKTIRLIILILFMGFIAGSITGCSIKPRTASFDINSVKSYRDIPGVTDEEIKAIEALKSQRQSFSYGSLPTIESFVLNDGTFEGFTPLFCKFLSGLFDIPFVPELYHWNSLKDGVDSGTIDFTGVLTPLPERKAVYSMTHPIAEHSLRLFTHGDRGIKTEEDINGFKIGTYRDSITVKTILDAYPFLKFQVVYFENSSGVVESLLTDKIDAFVDESTSVIDFERYPFIISRELFPLVYTSVSMSTIKPELQPIISVVDKYLVAGGINKVHELGKEGYHQYARYELEKTLTGEEKAYLDDLATSGTRVHIGLEPGNYPVCFYNERTNEFEGIAPDILREISSLTGITFNVVTGKNSVWPEILSDLTEGKISLVSELIYSDDRKENFLWADYPYTTYRFALISKSAYPNLETYQVISSTVGIGKDSAYEYFYNKWFPNSTKVKIFETLHEATTALEKGKIDLLMASEYDLLTMMNYYETPGYKANIVFDAPVAESFFGFNKNEKVLRSIISKAQYYTDTERIVKDWTGRVFDYSRIYEKQRFTYLSVSAVVLSLILVVLVVLLVKNNKTKRLFKKQAITISAIYQSLPDMVYCMDATGKYTSCNHLFEEFAGLSESDIIGKNALEVYTLDEKAARHYMETTQKVLDKKSIVKEEEWVTYPNHTSRLMETMKAPLIQDGKTTGILGISRDITEHKAAEDAANNASRAKSEFLAKMSHEIRTPMNAIIGMTELALRAHKLDNAREHIFTVKQASANLLSIINDILDFSKIETGKLEIIPEEYLFSSLVNDVISIIRMRVLDSQIRFAVNIDSQIPNALIGDELRLRQVLLNLLNNAVKYTEKGFVSFTVYGELLNNDVVNLVMEVMDSGRGIKEENIKNLFGEYAQFDLDKNKFIEGTGLGLAISKTIVTAMAGEISVYSEYGKGSTFTVTVPQKISSPEVLASVEKPQEKSVIVYERREIFANSIVFAIGNLGVECTLVASDSALYEKIKAKPYSFIFISFGLYIKNKSTISEFAASAKVVVLTEFGEAIPDSSLNVLAMPVHSISIADILNGVSRNFSYNENNDLIVRFMAPDVKVLVVDDINTNLKVAQGLLLPYKVQVDLRKSGAEAIEAVRSGNYDLVFMDHKMPEMDGVEATLRIRAMGTEEPYYNNLPIIALTANAVSGMRELFIRSGFNDFLSKPIDTVALNTILEKWIPKEKQQKPAAEEGETELPKEKDPNPSSGIAIEGVDIAKGMAMSGGSTDSYMETLELFYGDGLEKIKEIAACAESGNLPLYTTHVHGLKSASASIGAGTLSLAAKELEAAGERKDLAFIETHNEEFLQELKYLLNRIKDTLVLYRRNRERTKTGPDRDLLKHELIRLKTALDVLDAGTINEAMENLRNFAGNGEIGEVIKKVSNNILIAEYNDAAALIEKALREDWLNGTN